MPVAKINSIEVFENRIDEFFNHISNGGSATQYCKLVNCDYAVLMSKIRSNEESFKRYRDAVDNRKEWAKERIYEELQYMGNYNIKDAVRADGTMKTIQELPEDLSRSIKEVDVDGSIKFQDKLKALDQKQKLLGLSVDKVEVTGRITLADMINQARKIED